MTACAFKRLKEAVALISDEITLVRYSSMEITLIAVSLSSSTIIFRLPLNLCVSLRSQWKLMPMVTSFSSKKVSVSCMGENDNSLYAFLFEKQPFVSLMPSCHRG